MAHIVAQHHRLQPTTTSNTLTIRPDKPLPAHTGKLGRPAATSCSHPYGTKNGPNRHINHSSPRIEAKAEVLEFCSTRHSDESATTAIECGKHVGWRRIQRNRSCLGNATFRETNPGAVAVRHME